MLKLALAGNPNCGKTTLFNRLTGSKAHTGNRPGVTVEVVEKMCIAPTPMLIADLPGVYSLYPYSPEEEIACGYILNEKPNAIINIVDTSNIERNLYLTTQLIETGVPVVLALNMIDEAQKRGDKINTAKMSELMKIPVVPISALKNKGIDRLIDAAVDTALNKRRTPNRLSLKDMSEDMYEKAADRRYRYVEDIVKKCIVKGKRTSLSSKTDLILTNRFTALPLFFLIMFMIFCAAFGSLGSTLSNMADSFINGFAAEKIKDMLLYINTDDWLVSLITDGIIKGTGSVVIFLPQILILFTFLSLLEDTGYMARASFITDRLLSGFGMSGKSFIPLIMGFGCSVPAIMASRTLKSQRERMLTIMLIPFMTCGARAAVFTAFVSAVFKGNKAVTVSLYILGVAVALLSGIILDKTVLRSADINYIAELPPYRMPSLRTVLIHIWEKAADFISKVYTTLLTVSVAVWFFQSFDTSLHIVGDNSQSIIAAVGKALSPIFIPCGFGHDWRCCSALLSGIAAKETVISTLGILYGEQPFYCGFTPLSAYSFLVFVLLYMPCAAAFITVGKEMKSIKWAVFSALYQTGAAWIASAAVYRIGSFFLG